MPSLTESMEWIRGLLAIQQDDTVRQLKWKQRLLNAEKLVSDALGIQQRAALDPADEALRRNLSARLWQANFAVDQLRRGTQSHVENYHAAHGATVADRRAGWNRDYHERVLRKEGRIARTNAKPSEMTEEDRIAHKRRQERERQKRSRAAKQGMSKQRSSAKHPLSGKF